MSYYEGYEPTLPDARGWTFGEILNLRINSHADDIYLDVPSTRETYTYREAGERARSVAAGLIGSGLTLGDRVVIMLPNSSAFMFSWMGLALSGLVQVPINTAYRGTFLEHQIRLTEPSAAIATAEYAHRLIESKDAAQSIQRIYLVGTDAELAEVSEANEAEAAGFDIVEFDSLLRSSPLPLPDVGPTDLGAIFFTSGTTGLSKGVMMSQAHLFFFADQVVSLTRLTQDDVFMSVGPLFHGNAQFMAAYPALVAGARYVMREKFSASNWARWVRESSVTVTNFLGVMMDWVWKQPPDPLDAQNQLRCVFAAPTPGTITEGFGKRFGVETFVEVFGLTETSPVILTPYGTDRPAGAAGMANRAWFDVRLVDPDTDEEVPVGQVGELVVRPIMPWTSFSGYFRMPDRTAASMRNCWIHTGDALRQDADGWYYFVDRIKDSIRRRGENISSYEVELAMLESESITECAVVAVPADGDAAEDEVMVHIVRAHGAKLSPADVWEWADRRLPSFAVPRYVKFVDSLPVTPSGKIMKAELREEATVNRHDREAQSATTNDPKVTSGTA